MKKNLMALAVALLVGITGCGNNNSANTDNAESTESVDTVETVENVETPEENVEEASTEEKNDEDQSESGENKELRKVTFVLDWTPNTNHTGLYVAQEKGYYAEKGLDVEIVQPPEDGATALVASGKAQFAISAQDSMANVLGGDAAMPITAIGAIIQHNTSGIISRADEGLDRPKGLEGKRYSTWNLPVEINTIKQVMEEDGGNFDKLTLIPAAPIDEVAALREEQTDAIWVFEGWGKVSAEVQDYPVDYWNFADIDDTFDFYTPVIIAGNDLIENDKELVKDFMEATRMGYEFAIENPKESADILLAADDALDSDLVYASQEFLSTKYKDDADKWGVIDPERWSRYYNWLNENGLVDTELDINSGYTNEFVE